MKKLLGMFLSIAIVVGTLPMISVMADTGTTQVQYDGGEGTAISPYLISTPEQLKKMRDDVNTDKNNGCKGTFYKLTEDIDLKNVEWTPIGLDDYGFQGSFDGDGHVVKNFKITDSVGEDATNLGFFGSGNDLTIKNLGIESVTINVSKKNAVGVMVGRAGTAYVENCYVKNSSITNTNGLACGFTGYVRSASTYRNCYVYNCTLSGETKIPFCCIENFNEHNKGDVFTNCYVAECSKADYSFLKGNHNRNNDRHELTYAPNLINCFSTVAKEGDPSAVSCDQGGNSHTHNNIAVGMCGATKVGIVAVLTNSGAYMADSSINNGYPHLNFENSSVKSGWDGTTKENYTGTGTQTDPYKIENAAQLAKFSDDVNASQEDYKKKYVELTADIDLNGKEWIPIGYRIELSQDREKEYYFFSGEFNGKGHIVKNFSVATDRNHGGLFGYTEATIKNLGVENVSLNGKFSYAGAIAGKGTLKLYDCYVKNSSITTTGRAGGLVGALRGGSTFEDCYTDGVTVSSSTSDHAGCLVGNAENVNEGNHKFINCYTANTNGANSVMNKSNATNSSKWTVDKVYTTGTAMTDNIGETQTVEKIKTDLIGTNKYKAGNGDLPVLAWETVKDLSGAMPYVVEAVSENDDKTLNITLLENKSSDGTLYAAAYDNDGRLIAVETFDASSAKSTVKTTTVLSDAKTVKVFAWDSDMNIIAEVYQKTA